MIRDLDRAIIDEVQLAPDLLRAIKEFIDNDRRPGRFLLTGSANILTAKVILPKPSVTATSVKASMYCSPPALSALPVSIPPAPSEPMSASSQRSPALPC
jgi:hypothetical protein